MNVHDLTHSMLEFDTLAVRQWLADADAKGFDWTCVAEPEGRGAVEAALTAGVVELMCSRVNKEPPAWTARIGPMPEEVFLVRHAHTMPRLLETCRTLGPEPLRKRGFLAPPEYLKVA